MGEIASAEKGAEQAEGTTDLTFSVYLTVCKLAAPDKAAKTQTSGSKACHARSTPCTVVNTCPLEDILPAASPFACLILATRQSAITVVFCAVQLRALAARSALHRN